MTLSIDRLTHEYAYVGITGTIPAVGAEVAILPLGERPLEGDWVTAILVLNDTHPLWVDATGSGATGNYFVAVKVGDDAFGPPDIELGPGSYAWWLRLTDIDERPIRLAPEDIRVL